MGSQYPSNQRSKNLSDIHCQLIAHVFNTHFVSLRALIINEVIGLRRLSTNCGFGLISVKPDEDVVHFVGEMENCLLEYLVYYGYLLLCLS